MKKVSIISTGLSDGGLERVSSILANYLSKKGYKVEFIAAFSKEKQYKLDENIEYNFINVKSKNKIKRLLERCLKIKNLISKFDPDVIVSFICNETLLIKDKKRIIYTLRNDPKNTEKNFINKNLRNYLYKKSKSVIFQTPEARDYFCKKIANKSYVILNPVDTENLPKWEKFNHKKRIVTACRLSKQKNIPLLINAFRKIANDFPEYNLEIYGRGSEKKEILDIIKNYQIESRIKLMGYSNEIHKIMAESSMFVLTSDYEGLSNSMLESLAIGVPTICTDCPPGGARLVIENGINGFLTKVNDVNDLSSKMKELLDNQNLMKKFNKNNKKYRCILNENKICEEWENVLLK